MAAGRLRYRRPRSRVRAIFSTATLLLLAGLPIFLGFTAPLAVIGAPDPGLYDALRMAAMIACPFAVIFAVCVIAAQHREVNLRILNQNGRNQRNLRETARSLAVIGGSAALIVGSLAALYCGVLAARPDLIPAPGLPLTMEMAFACLLLGGPIYAAGRIGKTY